MEVQEQEMMDRIRPIVQARIAHLISDRVQKMTDTIDKQNWKIVKLS